MNDHLVTMDGIRRLIKDKKEVREKKVLLKEIHHRVKNNMQIIVPLASYAI